MGDIHDAENARRLPQGEKGLQIKQLRLRTNLEMWLMDAVPELFGVDDSDELDDRLNEDEQAELVELLLSLDEGAVAGKVVDWIGDGAQGNVKRFADDVAERVKAIRAC